MRDFAIQAGLTDTEADEVVQETAIAMARHLPEFRYDPKVPELSKREYEILRLLASGKPVKVIAHDLCLSAQTISTHRARMLKKFGLQSTAELIRYAIQNRLVE